MVASTARRRPGRQCEKENMYGDEVEDEDEEGQEKQDLNLHTARATLIPTQAQLEAPDL